MNTPEPVSFRFLCREDHAEVVLTEACCFQYPWDLRTLRVLMNQRDTIGLVAQNPGRVTLGHMVYSLWSRGVLTLRRFAVRPEYQGKGVGRAMVGELLEKLHPDRRTRIELCCRESNLDGQLFWRAVGFKATGIIPGCYPDSGEDGYVFAFELPDTALMGVLPNSVTKHGARVEWNGGGEMDLLSH